MCGKERTNVARRRGEAWCSGWGARREIRGGEDVEFSGAKYVIVASASGFSEGDSEVVELARFGRVMEYRR